MKLSEDLISKQIKKWINAWNSKDIDSILSLYFDSIHFANPKIQKLFLDYKTNTITNKNDLKNYFLVGLQKFPNLKFPSIDL